MRVNPTTLLFEDISPGEREEMLAWADRAILNGEQIVFPADDPPWLIEWMKVAGYDVRQRLLLISTAVPQRVLLSLLREKNNSQDQNDQARDREENLARAAVFEEESLSQRDREAQALAKLLSDEGIADLTKVCTAIIPVTVVNLEGLQGFKLAQVENPEEGTCWPTAYGRRVYTWLEILGRLPTPPEVPTLERVNAILERVGINPNHGVLLERIRSFALDWFVHFTNTTPPADVELVRRASEHYNTHRCWPWEISP